jgi:hypothetical protein
MIAHWRIRAIAAYVLALAITGTCFSADPLGSWNEGPAKRAVMTFVDEVTSESSGKFVAAPERIATFDNDGTLWAEQPMYFQLAFALDRAKALASKHPEWKDQEPFKSVLTGDIKAALAGGEKAALQLLAATHSGMTSDDFEMAVTDWIATARHPKSGRLYTIGSRRSVGWIRHWTRGASGDGLSSI